MYPDTLLCLTNREETCLKCLIRTATSFPAFLFCFCFCFGVVVFLTESIARWGHVRRAPYQRAERAEGGLKKLFLIFFSAWVVADLLSQSLTLQMCV